MSVRRKAAASERCGQLEANPKRLVTVKEAAALLNCSPKFVRRLICSRQLRVITGGRRYLIDVRDLDEWIERAKRFAR